jgi:aspartate ammonia-lyase
MRKEKDIIGFVDIPAKALYGINSVRAKENFPACKTFPEQWYRAIGLVKSACYETYKNLKCSALEEFGDNLNFQFFNDEIISALIKAANEVSEGKWFSEFIVPAVQGGAGTSFNMNVNEIIANRSLILINKKPGTYDIIHPNDHANIFQSTNDVIPTSLRLVIMQLLQHLEDSINLSRLETERLENENKDIPRIAYTQLQQAVPTTYGRLFSTYSDALSRDWWRVSKCFERIKVVNLGGNAIGTSLGVPRFFVLEVVQTLQRLTGLPITRSENLSDATSNLDSFVEVHAILKSHAVNLEKIAGDLRLLASDISIENLKIPAKQAGSSIMPGKINPVIPEYLISLAHKVYSNDSLITNLCAQSQLELNAYIPEIGYAIIETLNLLISANKTFRENLLVGISIDKQKAEEIYIKSPAVCTVLIPYIGYEKAGEYAKFMRNSNTNIYAANKVFKLIEESKLEDLLQTSNLLKQGFSFRDLL